MDNQNEFDEDNEIILFTGMFGNINNESKIWDDLEDIEKEELLKSKIINIKIF